MKQIVCLILVLSLVLCGCAGAPAETNAPPETSVPVQTTTPPETTAPAFSAYTLRIEDPETMIYAGPGFLSGALELVGEAGTYTIVEEALDPDGNTWGRLKSGAGWVCLT